VHKLLSCRGSNKTGTTRSRDKTNTYGSAISSNLTWYGMGTTSLSSPVSTTNRRNIKLSSSDCSTDCGSYLRCTLNSESNVTAVISKSNKGLETSGLTSRRLLLYGHDLHNLVLELVLEEVLDDLSLLNRQGEEEDLLEGLDLSFLD